MYVYEKLRVLRIQESIKKESSTAAPKLRPWSRQWSQLNCSAKTPQFVPLHGKLHLSLAQPTTRRHQYTKKKKQHNDDDCELHVSGLEVAQALRETQSRRLEDFFPFFVVRREASFLIMCHNIESVIEACIYERVRSYRGGGEPKIISFIRVMTIIFISVYSIVSRNADQYCIAVGGCGRHTSQSLR